MTLAKWLALVIGILVVIAQVVEWQFNNVLSDWEKKKADIYADYERYLDFRVEAQTLRGTYNTLQAVNNSLLNETMIIREKEMLNLILGSVLALSNHIDIENKSEWTSMDYYQLMNVTAQLDVIVNSEYQRISTEVQNSKVAANTASAFKFGLLAVEVIIVAFDKKK